MSFFPTTRLYDFLEGRNPVIQSMNPMTACFLNNSRLNWSPWSNHAELAFSSSPPHPHPAHYRTWVLWWNKGPTQCPFQNPGQFLVTPTTTLTFLPKRILEKSFKSSWTFQGVSFPPLGRVYSTVWSLSVNPFWSPVIISSASKDTVSFSCSYPSVYTRSSTQQMSGSVC